MSKISTERKNKRRENIRTAEEMFRQFDGKVVDGFPVVDADVFHTDGGTPYLQKPGVVLISKPSVSILGMRKFLRDYGEDLGFEQYLDDPTLLDNSTQLAKVAGQECYASYGPNRTFNVDADGYIEDIKNEAHGSVLQHPAFSFLVYGISRSVSHEWVRHGTGTAYSQRSQRYVSGKVLRFVERPEYQNDPELHKRFERRIDQTAEEYRKVTEHLLNRQRTGADVILKAGAKTDMRKKIQQSSRSVLTNETETSFVTSVNARSIQHMLTMRTSEHAEVEIRRPFVEILLCLMITAPTLFADFEITKYSDGTFGARSPYEKP